MPSPRPDALRNCRRPIAFIRPPHPGDVQPRLFMPPAPSAKCSLNINKLIQVKNHMTELDERFRGGLRGPIGLEQGQA